MEIPILRQPPSSRQTVDTFYGYDHNLRIADGRFYEMENMTSDHFPVLSTRQKRSIYKELAQPRAMAVKDGLCYIDGPDLYVKDTYVPGLTLADGCDICPYADRCGKYTPGKASCEKQFVPMGAYLLIFPDKVWVRPSDLQFGSLEHIWKNQEKEVKVSLCKADGTGYGTIPTQQPQDPTEGQVWQDGNVLRQYTGGAWVAVESTYLRIFCYDSGLDQGFSQYDGITIEGLPEVSGSAVVWKTAEDTLIVAGTVSAPISTTGAVTISRRLPEMDYVLSCGNRLWGCRYGENEDGTFVNEIYCSRLGDFKNFNCFMGISTDSAVLNLGSDGPFTGAISYLDHPVFFKENMLHKVYISASGAHSVSDTPCRGVQKGCHKSLAIANEVLYYKAPGGICAYDGSLPVEVSGALGKEDYENAVAGAVGNKYYISMEQEGKSRLFVYDTQRKLWHAEDDLKVIDFCPYGKELYAMGVGQILALQGSVGQAEESLPWSVQTGVLGLHTPDSKYLAKLTVRLALDVGAQAAFYVRYDFDNQWEHLCTVTGDRLQSFEIPIRPKRCDTMALRIEGQGGCKLYALTKTLERGSEKP